MKKLLLSLSLVLAASTGIQAQNQFSFGFDGTTAAMEAAGWVRTNQSTPAGLGAWNIPAYTEHVVTAAAPYNAFSPVATPLGGTTTVPNGQAGGANSFAVVNFQSTTGAGTISNWLITPTITVQNGDVVSFYTRIGKITTAADPDASFPDNLQLRMSTNGGFTANPTGGSTGLGDFTTLLAEVNPTLNVTAYPTAWGQITATIAGLAGPTDVKFAFRYFVTNGGPAGDNSDIIGIDTFSVDRTLGTKDFFASNFAVYPNPASSVLNVDAKTSVINEMQITDLNGRIVKNVKANGVANAQINISDLNTGVYFLKVTSNEGTGTTKVVKN